MTASASASELPEFGAAGGLRRAPSTTTTSSSSVASFVEKSMELQVM